ncbi:MAG: primosomal protein N', partial [Eubacterium sp.]
LDMLGDVGGSIRSLEKKGLIKAYERETCGAFEKHHRLDVIDLSAEQNNFYEKYQALAFEKSPCFIWGYDLYSKVRLYAKLSEDCLKKGKTTVILFPEIGLTLEKKAFFYQVFGNEAAICHGKMGDKEKYHMYRRVRCGEVKVLIGSRSALFMPMKNLGLIIVDEQRDPSYYSVAMPKYNTIDVAEHYAALCGAKLLASDEIPSVSALYKIEQGSWSVIKGNEAGKENRAVDVIDMQQEMKNGNYDFMSVALKEKIDEAMALDRVSLLMINKRGYASYVFCRNCGHVEKCPTCGVALKYYAGSGVLKCHYCGYTKNNSHVCPACAQKKMKALGLGIDQVYELLIKRYPNARILKIDSETVPDHETFKTINQGL